MRIIKIKVLNFLLRKTESNLRTLNDMPQSSERDEVIEQHWITVQKLKRELAKLGVR